jgi:hypothetical protein
MVIRSPPYRVGSTGTHSSSMSGISARTLPSGGGQDAPELHVIGGYVGAQRGKLTVIKASRLSTSRRGCRPRWRAVPQRGVPLGAQRAPVHAVTTSGRDGRAVFGLTRGGYRQGMELFAPAEIEKG